VTEDLGVAVGAALQKRVTVVVTPAASTLTHGVLAWSRPRGFLIDLLILKPTSDDARCSLGWLRGPASAAIISVSS